MWLLCIIYLDYLLAVEFHEFAVAVELVLDTRQQVREWNYSQSHQLNQPLHLIMDFLQSHATCHFVYFLPTYLLVIGAQFEACSFFFLSRNFIYSIFNVDDVWLQRAAIYWIHQNTECNKTRAKYTKTVKQI